MQKACVSAKRDLFMRLKRPIPVAKEAYEYSSVPEVVTKGLNWGLFSFLMTSVL